MTEKLSKKIIDKIRKRIRTRELMECKTIEEIQITKKEAEQIGERTFIDNVKLIIVDKLGDMTNKDCFAYIERNGHKSCYSLNNLECKNKKCKFYRTDIKILEVENSIKEYVLKS